MDVKLEITVYDQRSRSQTKISYFMTKDYGHKVRFSPAHFLEIRGNLLKYPECVKKIGNLLVYDCLCLTPRSINLWSALLSNPQLNHISTKPNIT